MAPPSPGKSPRPTLPLAIGIRFKLAYPCARRCSPLARRCRYWPDNTQAPQLTETPERDGAQGPLPASLTQHALDDFAASTTGPLVVQLSTARVWYTISIPLWAPGCFFLSQIATIQYPSSVDHVPEAKGKYMGNVKLEPPITFLHVTLPHGRRRGNAIESSRSYRSAARRRRTVVPTPEWRHRRSRPGRRHRRGTFLLAGHF